MAAYLCIPVQGTCEEVQVAVELLPEDVNDILEILKAEQAPLSIWLSFARSYFQQGRFDAFLQILEEGSSPDIDEYYVDMKFDRIAVLNALGAYYTNLGRVEIRDKDEHFLRASQYYNKASRIDHNEASTWLGKGQLLLAKREFEQAHEVFRIVLDCFQDNVAAMLGQACVHFNCGRFRESLELYKKVVQLHPRFRPSSVRVALGLCRLQLGELQKAKQAFHRALELDRNNVEALVGLGLLELNEGRVGLGLDKMRRAYEVYPYCALALNHLANHCVFTDQHSMVEHLMEAALVATDDSLTKSQSYYNLARSCHVKEEFEMAAKYYRASIAEVKNFPSEFILPFYGLGQVLLKLGDWKAALANFEKVVELHPENSESFKAIGHILMSREQLECADKALEHFKKATRLNPRDVDAWLEMGELQMTMVSSSSHIAGTLESFQTARSLLMKNEVEVPVTLLNNIGVLHFERGDLESAMQAYKQALRELGTWIDDFSSTHDHMLIPSEQEDELFRCVDVPAEKVTVLFNLAILHERLHENGKACILYRLILSKHPDYKDADLRLGTLALARGDVNTGLDFVCKALNVDEMKLADGLSVRGNWEMKSGDWIKAKDTFKEILDLKDGDDTYAMLALGNWNYTAASATRGAKKSIAPELEAMTYLEKSQRFYQKALTQQPNNMYAANGIGIVLAERGLFKDAKDIFKQVQEAAVTGTLQAVNSIQADVWINLGHTYLAQGQFALAVKMYRNCLERSYHNTESQILLYIARAYYEAEQYHECKRTLLRAMHLNPSNHTLRFNAAISMQKFSTTTLQKSKKSADEVWQAILEVKSALKLFSQLAAGVDVDQGTHGFDLKKVNMHGEYCKHLLDAAKVHLEAAEREEQLQAQQKQVVAVAEDARRKDEEQRLQKRMGQRDELGRLMVAQLEHKLQQTKATWNMKRVDAQHMIDEERTLAERKAEKKKKVKREN